MKRLLLLLLMCAPAWAENNFLTDTDCVALWKMENGALTIDTIGGNTLIARNTPTADTSDYQEGGASVDIDPGDELYSDDHKLDDDFPLKTGGTGTFSFCCWFKADSLPGDGDYQVIASKRWTVPGGRSWMVALTESGGVVQPVQDIGYNSGNSSYVRGVWNAEDGALAIPSGTWCHIGVTFNNATNAYRLLGWNGTETRLREDTLPDGIYLNATEFIFGAEDGFAYDDWDGHIDEAVFFKDILTADEIDQIRLGTYGASAATGTSNWWWRRRHNN